MWPHAVLRNRCTLLLLTVVTMCPTLFKHNIDFDKILSQTWILLQLYAFVFVACENSFTVLFIPILVSVAFAFLLVNTVLFAPHVIGHLGWGWTSLPFSSIHGRKLQCHYYNISANVHWIIKGNHKCNNDKQLLRIKKKNTTMNCTRKLPWTFSTCVSSFLRAHWFPPVTPVSSGHNGFLQPPLL